MSKIIYKHIVISGVLLLIFVSSYAQQDICSRFKRSINQSHTRPLKSGIFDADLAQQWANYFEYSAWKETRTDANFTYFKATGGNKPNRTYDEGEKYDYDLALPPAPKEIFNKHFTKEFLDDCKSCRPPLKYSSYAPNKNAVNSLLALREDWNLYARRCKKAATALRQYKEKRNALIADMQNYCANQEKDEVGKRSKDDTNIKETSISLSPGKSTTDKKTSYAKAKASIKKSKASQKIDGEALLRARQYEEYQRQLRSLTLQGQWESLNEMDRKLTTFLQNTFWNNLEERQRKEQIQYSIALSRESSIFGSRMNDHIENWQNYQMKITNWLLDYSEYTNPKILERLQSDFKKSQTAISKAYIHYNKIKRQYDRRRENGPNGVSAKGLGKIQWDSFVYSSEYQDIKGAPFSAIYELRALLESNPTDQKRSMLADYAKIAYSHAKQYSPKNKRKYVQYARDIVDNFFEYPGLTTLQNEVTSFDKEEFESNRLKNIRKSFDEVFTLSYKGNNEELDQLVEKLIKVPATEEIKESFFGPKGNHSKLNKLYKNGHTETLLKLYDWLDGRYELFKNKRNSYELVQNLIDAYLISDNKLKYNVKNEINTLINSHISWRFKMEGNYSYTSIEKDFRKNALKVLAGNIDLETVKNKAKLLRKASKRNPSVYNTWYAKALLFMNGQEAYLLPKNNDSFPQTFLGIWTRVSDNQSYEEVTYVVPGSPADLNNIQKGDKLKLDKKSGFSKPYKDIYYEKSYVDFSILKKDGKTYRIKIPVRITKNNIKNKFKGTSELVVRQ